MILKYQLTSFLCWLDLAIKFCLSFADSSSNAANCPFNSTTSLDNSLTLSFSDDYEEHIFNNNSLILFTSRIDDSFAVSMCLSMRVWASFNDFSTEQYSTRTSESCSCSWCVTSLSYKITCICIIIHVHINVQYMFVN